jgi:hypothetical protein
MTYIVGHPNQEIRLSLRVPVEDMRRMLDDIKHCPISKSNIAVIVEGSATDEVGEDIKQILQQADNCGIEIIDRTPGGSILKRYLSWILRPCRLSKQS